MLSGRDISDRLLQPKNALMSIRLTPLGILILLRLEQFANESEHISVTPEGIVYELSAFPAGYCINSVLLLLKSTPFTLE